MIFFSRSRNALLNGDTKHYDWDSGYTCHQLGSGAILIQLGKVLNYHKYTREFLGILIESAIIYFRSTVHYIQFKITALGL